MRPQQKPINHQSSSDQLIITDGTLKLQLFQWHETDKPLVTFTDDTVWY